MVDAMTDAVTAAAADDECLGPGATMRVRSSVIGNPFGWAWTRARLCSTPAAAAGRRGITHRSPETSPGASTRSTLARVRRWSFRPVVCWICSPVLWSGSRTRDRRFIRPLLYPLSYPTAGGSPGTRTRPLSEQPLVTRIRCPSAMRHVRHPQTHPDAAHRRGGFHPSPWPVSIRL